MVWSRLTRLYGIQQNLRRRTGQDPLSSFTSGDVLLLLCALPRAMLPRTYEGCNIAQQLLHLLEANSMLLDANMYTLVTFTCCCSVQCTSCAFLRQNQWGRGRRSCCTIQREADPLSPDQCSGAARPNAHLVCAVHAQMP